MRTTSPQSNQHLAGAGRLQRIQVDMLSTAEEMSADKLEVAAGGQAP